MNRKWIIGIVTVFILLGWAIPSDAQYVKKYTLYLGPTDTGTTRPVTVSLSGVTEPMVIDDGLSYKRRAQDTTLKGLSLLPSGNAMLYLDTISPTEADTALGNYAGNTFFVCAKFGHAGSNFHLLEKIPLVLNMAISGNTPQGIPFEIPPGTEWAQIFFGTSGVTHYGNVKASLVVGLSGTNWKPPDALYLDTLVFNLTATTGTSAFTGTDSNGKSLPQGTRFIVLQNSAVSGVTVLYREGGATIDNSTAPYIDADDRWFAAGSYESLKQWGVKALGTTVLRALCFTAYPISK